MQASTLFLHHGANRITKKESNLFLLLLFDQLKNFFIVLLILAGGLAFYLGEITQVIVIALVVVVNISLGVAQSYKAQKALQKLKKIITHHAIVKRDGKVIQILSEEVVPGDILVVEAGDRVVADGRVIYEKELTVDESLLTGESKPVGKNSQVIQDQKLNIAEQKNMVFSGTTVTAGKGEVIVTSTGNNTELARIASILSESDEKTLLEQRLEKLGLIIALGAAAFALIILFVGVSRGEDFLEMTKFAVALLVGAVPESLPTVVTLALSVGVLQMAKNKAIVRRLPAVETLGSVTLIATDKTGTLTENKLKVEEVGILNQGKFQFYQTENLPKKEAALVSNMSVLASHATLKQGDPLEQALVAMASKFNVSEKIRTDNKLIDEIPFSSQRKYMATLYRRSDSYVLAVKGALDILMPHFSLSDGNKKEIIRASEEMAKQGYRLIALGRKESKVKPKLDLEKLEFLGVVAMIDPVAPGVKESLAATKEAGIKTIMITGDHYHTASAIASKINLPYSQAVSGDEVDGLSDDKLDQLTRQLPIFARITPFHKLKIIESLKRNKEVVAVTGDGVNDAPALKSAHVGVAMGQRGTEVAKEAADIILLDDSYKTIASAVGFGRSIFRNIQTFITFLLTGNFSELMLVAFAFIIGLPFLPITAAQILWLNLVTDSFPALALAFEKHSGNLQDSLPSKGDDLYKAVARAFLLSFFAVLIMAGMLYVLDTEPVRVQTILFTYLVFFQLTIVFSIRRTRPIWSRKEIISFNPWLTGAVITSLAIHFAVLYTPLSILLNTVALTGPEMLLVVVATAITFILAEITKE